MRIHNHRSFSFEETLTDYVEKITKSEWVDVKLLCDVDYNNDRDKNCIISSRHNKADVSESVGADENSLEVVDVVRLTIGGKLTETWNNKNAKKNAKQWGHWFVL